MIEIRKGAEILKVAATDDVITELSKENVYP
jgi:hypothetical protein